MVSNASMPPQVSHFPARHSHYYTVLIILIKLAVFTTSTNNYLPDSSNSEESILNRIYQAPELIKPTLDTVNATAVKVSVNLTALARPIRGQELMELQIEYQIMFKEINIYNYELETCESILLKASITPQNTKTEEMRTDAIADHELCLSSIFMFGGYNDSSDAAFDHLTKHCGSQIFIMNLRRNETFAIINDLLPGRLYEFRYQLFGPNRELISEVHPPLEERLICTPTNIPPLYPPQTDLGSFIAIVPTEEEIRKNIAKTSFKQTRKIQLFWRPVPKLFVGGPSDKGIPPLTYEVWCKNIGGKPLDHRYTTLTHEEGKFAPKVPFYKDTAYSCEIRSKNKYGYSKDSSIIHIPEQSRIIDTQGKFGIYSIQNPVKTPKQRIEYLYQLKWANMTQLLTDSITSQNITSTLISQPLTGTYTVFWCITPSEKSKGCERIDGIKKNSNTTLTMKIPTHVVTETTFGVAFRSDKNKLYSGITWSTCLAKSFSANEPLIITLFSATKNHIVIKWTTQPCISIIILFKEYHIQYCPLNSVDPCQSQSNDTNALLKTSSSEFNDKDCIEFKIPNEFGLTEARLANLVDSTTYKVRVRASFNVTVPIVWSNVLLASTTNMKSCFWSRNLNLVLTLLVLIALVIMVFVKRKKVISFYNEIQLLLEARASMPRRIEEILNKEDNISEIEMKYWVDHTPENASLNDFPYYCESEKGLATENNIYKSNTKEEKSFSVPDYIDPIYLTNGQSGTSTQDSFTEYSRNSDKLSETDDSDGDSEISIASHSSFINNLLKEDNDFNDS